jgi:hypothetical protein
MYLDPTVFALLVVGSLLGACGLWWALVVGLSRLFKVKW